MIEKNPPPKRISGQTIFLGASIVICIAVVVGLVVLGKADGGDSRLKLENIPFNGARAYEYLKQLCAIGPRLSGSPGMEAQQKLLAEHFQKLGARVEFQRFRGKYPADGPDAELIGREVPMANLIVRWNPESKDRILLCAHYDTLPFPLRDPENRKGSFIGANDCASGVAILMELGNELAKHPPKRGVDFVLFDAEEFIFSEEGTYFLGSEHFAREYANGPHEYRYRWGVLMDMVGGADLQLYEEVNSVGWPDTQPLVKEIWATAARLGVSEFIARPKYEVRDDHLALHDIGRIPTCDLIDFDYPPWHTQGDRPGKCSALSLAKVGWVLQEWLKSGQ